MEGLANNNGTWVPLMPVAAQAVAPHFYYEETFESGDVFRGVSAGNGKFSDFTAVWPVPVLSFSVEKNRVLRTISIDVHSTTLQQHICRAIFAGSSSVNMMLLSFEIILQHYDALKCFLELLETQSPTALQTLELRLLVRDLLLDRAVFDGIGMEVYRDRNLVSLMHLHDIHQRSVDAGLDEIDDCFSLGLVPDNISNEYLSELNVRYSDLAVNGDYTGLFNLCEPIVRSGDIELQYNPALLLQVLDKGLLEIYRYLLDLVSRTREDSAKVPGSELPDVTYDPLHVAIRLGHTGKVRSLLDDGSTFKGHFSDESAVGRHHPIFTPISAAVFWRRPDIVRLLLSRGTFEQAELQKAITIAISNDFADIMKVILESGAIVSQDVSEVPAMGCSLLNQDDSIELHPELVVTEQNPQNGLAAYGDDAAIGQAPSESAQVDLQEPRDNFGKQPRQSPAAPKTTASLRRKGLKFLRQKLGRDLTMTVNSLCSRIREYCGGYPAGSAMSEVGGQFKSFGAVWQRGMDVIRRVMQNQPPDELVSVLDCLLVASSMCSALKESDDQLHVQFVNDLGRWRTVLGPTDQQLFDDITFALWAYTDVAGSKPSLERTESLYTFQELVQQLVLLEKDASRAARGGRRSGRRLDMIQREISQQNSQTRVSGPEPISIAPNGISQAYNDIAGSASSSRKRRFDGFSFADMLNLELFEDGPSEPIEESMQSEQSFDWKDILPITVLLLASVAFSIIFTMVIVLHVGSQDSPAAIIQHLGPGYARSAAILEEYLDIVHNRAPRFRGSMSSRQSSLAGPAQSFGSYASALSQRYGDFATPPSGVSSLDPSELTLASTSTTSHVSESQIPALSSPEALRPGSRLSCPSPHCPKTFSNVSNRNKHMREGCAYREKRGYRCRNPSCSKVLTTKWYRDTHERERCRFR